MNEEAFLTAILNDPTEPASWLALADWLDEHDDPCRAELLRLTRGLLQPGGEGRPAREERLRCLLAQGVRPCWPTLTSSVGMRLALVPAGTFLMGSPGDEEGRWDWEGPRHEVTISRSFYLGVYTVTQGQYERVTGTNPSLFPARCGWLDRKGQDTRELPVESVSWDLAVAFCRRLSKRPEEKRQGRVYRLPTEAEWEYACRGGRCSSTPFFFGHTLSSSLVTTCERMFEGGSGKDSNLDCTTAVGSYLPNAFGLYDMHGNVREWCADWFEAGYYAHSPTKDPKGPRSGRDRVVRGGSYEDSMGYCTSAHRASWPPDYADSNFGFRVALTASGG
jgi:uncharacterized protein (TIGR02996 family)